MVYSSGSITTVNTPAPASVWLFVSASWNVTAEESGSNPNSAKDRLSCSPSPNAQPQDEKANFNLLLAEDNLPDALLVREAIRAEGLPLTVHIVSDGQKAIDFIARSDTDENAPCPHLLLLDLNLPKQNGFEVLRRLRASKSALGFRSW